MGTKSAWTADRRARQRAAIRVTRPWEKSTGPRTEQGKAISSQNARSPDYYVDVYETLEDVPVSSAWLLAEVGWEK